KLLTCTYTSNASATPQPLSYTRKIRHSSLRSPYAFTSMHACMHCMRLLACIAWVCMHLCMRVSACMHAEPSGGTSSPTPLARKSPKPSHSIVGYWPLRGDFDVEFD